MSFDSYEPPRKDAPTVFPRFYTHPVQNEMKSKAAGRPIFDDIDYVEITVAGDTRTVVVERVKAEHKARWAPAYDAFKKGQEIATEGTPLEAWPALTPGQVAEYKALNIRTVDALAALDDSFLNKLGTGGRTIRAKAKAFLDTAAGFAPTSKMMAEVEDLKAQQAVDRQTIQALTAELDRLKAKIVEAA